VHYRFARQKSEFVRAALDAVATTAGVEDKRPVELRNWLTGLPGIGPKTASWVVRNHFGTDCVAILDVHIMRAGQFMGLFSDDARLPGDYFELESRFIRFASAISVSTALLDALMWMHMRDAPVAIHRLLSSTHKGSAHPEQSRLRKQRRQPSVPSGTQQAAGKSKRACGKTQLPLEDPGVTPNEADRMVIS